jgi:hypothetical protein
MVKHFLETPKQFTLKPVTSIFKAEKIENIGFINICKCNNFGVPHIHTSKVVFVNNVKEFQYKSVEAKVGMWIVENEKGEVDLINDLKFISLYQPFIEGSK